VAVGRKRHGGDSSGFSLDYSDWRSTGSIPKAERAVFTSREELPAIAGKRHRPDMIAVAGERRAGRLNGLRSEVFFQLHQAQAVMVADQQQVRAQGFQELGGSEGLVIFIRSQRGEKLVTPLGDREAAQGASNTVSTAEYSPQPAVVKEPYRSGRVVALAADR